MYFQEEFDPPSEDFQGKCIFKKNLTLQVYFQEEFDFASEDCQANCIIPTRLADLQHLWHKSNTHSSGFSCSLGVGCVHNACLYDAKEILTTV